MKYYYGYYTIWIRDKDCGYAAQEVDARSKKSARRIIDRVLNHTAAIIAIKNRVPKRDVHLEWEFCE